MAIRNNFFRKSKSTNNEAAQTGSPVTPARPSSLVSSPQSFTIQGVNVWVSEEFVEGSSRSTPSIVIRADPANSFHARILTIVSDHVDNKGYSYPYPKRCGATHYYDFCLHTVFRQGRTGLLLDYAKICDVCQELANQPRQSEVQVHPNSREVKSPYEVELSLEPSGDQQLPLSLQTEIDQLCSKFELALRSGEEPCVETYVSQLPDCARRFVLQELLGVDFELRLNSGRSLEAADYRRRFADHLDIVDAEVQRAQNRLPNRPPKSPDDHIRHSETDRSRMRVRLQHWLLGTANVDDANSVEAELRRNPVLTRELVRTLVGNRREAEDSGSNSHDADARLKTGPNPPSVCGRIGSFQIIRFLGAGGMGVVFEAQDQELQRRVALKTLKIEFANDSRAVARFLREMQAAASVRHDHIVTIYHVGKEDGVPYCALELLRGVSLDEHVRCVGSVHFSEAIEIVIQIAQGLAAAHAGGLIHRDIKPSNIWLTDVEQEGSDEVNRVVTATMPQRRWDRVKILDFGLAKCEFANSRITQTGQIIGTPHYMSPEQASGQRIDARADLFSLGCVLYRMLTGQLPFAGDSMGAVLEKIAGKPHQPVRELVSEVPATLADLVDRLLAKNRSARPGGANEVVRLLKAIQKQ